MNSVRLEPTRVPINAQKIADTKIFCFREQDPSCGSFKTKLYVSIDLRMSAKSRLLLTKIDALIHARFWPESHIILDYVGTLYRLAKCIEFLLVFIM